MPCEYSTFLSPAILCVVDSTQVTRYREVTPQIKIQQRKSKVKRSS